MRENPDTLIRHQIVRLARIIRHASRNPLYEVTLHDTEFYHCTWCLSFRRDAERAI